MRRAHVAAAQLDTGHEEQLEVFDDDPALVLARVAELLERPMWHRAASCRRHDPQLWFPERGQSLRPARATCDA